MKQSEGDVIQLERVQESVIDSNLVANNENVGIEIYRSVEPFPVADVTVSNNEVHHNHFIGINMAGCPAGECCRRVRNAMQVTVTEEKIIGTSSDAHAAGIYSYKSTACVQEG